MRLITTLLALSALASTAVFADEPAGSGSENPYSTNYEVRDGVQGSSSQDAPKIFRGVDKDADYVRLLEDGFDMLGSSAFQDSAVSPQLLVEQAKKVGAEMALVYTTALTKVPDAIKLQQAKSAAAMKGKRDEESNEKVPEWEAVSQAAQYYDYYATYWVKLAPPILGLHVLDHPANADEPGLPIVAVIKDSPAALADLRKGDVVLRIGNVEAKNGDTLVKEIRANAGKTVDITLLREDQLISKQVLLKAK
jgi:hypothetical protein